MRVAILGATSQIAKDLILSFSQKNTFDLVLFGRRPEVIDQWLSTVGLADRYVGVDFASFDMNEYLDVIINFVGSGNPAQTAMMGEGIFDATLKFDELALKYLHCHPQCRYIFLSSGAAYGSNFDKPADENTKAFVPINHLQSQDWYAVAKLYAECRHRALPHLHIVDIRIFNYFSHTQDIAARFFITDIIRAIKSAEILLLSSDNIVRDYLGPNDFHQLVEKILSAPPTNDVVDCYTLQPVDKLTLLAKMQERFGLNYEIRNGPAGINATGAKMNYFSVNKRATQFGYIPSIGSLEGVLAEVSLIHSA